MTDSAALDPAIDTGRGKPEREKRHPLFRLLQLFALALILGLLALLLWRMIAGSRGAELQNAIHAGRRPAAPAFSLPVIWNRATTWPTPLRHLLSEQKLSLVSLRGRPVVLNFWASWCNPCKAEAPRLAAAATANRGAVMFLGVDVQDLTSDARTFLRHFDVRYGSVRDNAGSTYDGYGLTGVPETFWLDARGRIVGHFAGPVSADQLAAGISLAKKSR